MLLSLRLPATGGPRLSESAVKALHKPAHIFQLLVHGHFAVIVETELLFALHGRQAAKASSVSAKAYSSGVILGLSRSIIPPEYHTEHQRAFHRPDGCDSRGRFRQILNLAAGQAADKPGLPAAALWKNLS